jgi:exonuclease III
MLKRAVAMGCKRVQTKNILRGVQCDGPKGVRIQDLTQNVPPWQERPESKNANDVFDVFDAMVEAKHKLNGKVYERAETKSEFQSEFEFFLNERKIVEKEETPLDLEPEPAPLAEERHRVDWPELLPCGDNGDEDVSDHWGRAVADGSEGQRMAMLLDCEDIWDEPVETLSDWEQQVSDFEDWSEKWAEHLKKADGSHISEKLKQAYLERKRLESGNYWRKRRIAWTVQELPSPVSVAPTVAAPMVTLLEGPARTNAQLALFAKEALRVSAAKIEASKLSALAKLQAERDAQEEREGAQARAQWLKLQLKKEADARSEVAKEVAATKAKIQAALDEEAKSVALKRKRASAVVLAQRRELKCKQDQAYQLVADEKARTEALAKSLKTQPPWDPAQHAARAREKELNQEKWQERYDNKREARYDKKMEAHTAEIQARADASDKADARAEEKRWQFEQRRWARESEYPPGKLIAARVKNLISRGSVHKCATRLPPRVWKARAYIVKKKWGMAAAAKVRAKVASAKTKAATENAQATAARVQAAKSAIWEKSWRHKLGLRLRKRGDRRHGEAQNATPVGAMVRRIVKRVQKHGRVVRVSPLRVRVRALLQAAKTKSMTLKKSWRVVVETLIHAVSGIFERHGGHLGGGNRKRAELTMALLHGLERLMKAFNCPRKSGDKASVARAILDEGIYEALHSPDRGVNWIVNAGAQCFIDSGSPLHLIDYAAMEWAENASEQKVGPMVLSASERPVELSPSTPSCGVEWTTKTGSKWSPSPAMVLFVSPTSAPSTQPCNEGRFIPSSVHVGTMAEVRHTELGVDIPTLYGPYHGHSPYTESTSPLVHLLCGSSLLGSGRKKRKQPASQRQGALHETQEFEGPQALDVSKQRKVVRKITWPMDAQPVCSGLRSLGNVHRTNELLSTSSYQLWQGSKLSASRTYSRVEVATSSGEVERMALDALPEFIPMGSGPDVAKLEHLDLSSTNLLVADPDDSTLPAWVLAVLCFDPLLGAGGAKKTVRPRKRRSARLAGHNIRVVVDGPPEATKPKRLHRKKPSKEAGTMVTTANSPKAKKASQKAFQEAGEGVVRLVNKPTPSPATAWRGAEPSFTDASRWGIGTLETQKKYSDSDDSDAEPFEPSDSGSSSSGEADNDGAASSDDEPLIVPKRKHIEGHVDRRRSHGGRLAPEILALVSGLTEAISSKNGNVRSDISKHRWDPSKVKGLTDEAVFRWKTDWLNDEVQTGMLQMLDDRKRVEVFETLLEGDDRLAVRNKITELTLTSQVRWVDIRDSWLFPRGKNVAIAGLRTIVRRHCGATETMPLYLDALVEASRRLGELCNKEKLKPSALVTQEIIQTFKEGLYINGGSGVKRMYKWIVKKEGENEEVTIANLRKKIMSVMHEADELQRKREPLKLLKREAPQGAPYRTFQPGDEEDEASFSQWHDHDFCDNGGADPIGKKPRIGSHGGSRSRSSLLSADALPDNEEERIVTLNVKEDTVVRTFTRDGEGAERKAGAKNTGKPPPTASKKRVLKRTTGALESDSDDDKPLTKKAMLKILQSPGGMVNQQRGGRGRGISDVNQIPLGGRTLDPCRHCGKPVEGRYKDHSCNNKTRDVYWCVGCAGVIPNANTPALWALHLHQCPKSVCKKCNLNDHFFMTCPVMTCRTCSKVGHFATLHFWTKNAPQEYLALLGDPIALKSAMARPDRAKQYKKTVQFGEEDVYDAYCDTDLVGSSKGGKVEPSPRLRPKSQRVKFCTRGLMGAGGEVCMSSLLGSGGTVNKKRLSSSSIAEQPCKSSCLMAAREPPMKTFLKQRYVHLVLHFLWRTDIEHLKLVSRDDNRSIELWIHGVLGESLTMRQHQLWAEGYADLNLAYVPVICWIYNTPMDHPCLCLGCQHFGIVKCAKHAPYENREAGCATFFKYFIQQERRTMPRTSTEAVHADLWTVAILGRKVDMLSLGPGLCQWGNVHALHHFTWALLRAPTINNILKFGQLGNWAIDHKRFQADHVGNLTPLNPFSMVAKKVAAIERLQYMCLACLGHNRAADDPTRDAMTIKKAFHMYLGAAMLIRRERTDCKFRTYLGGPQILLKSFELEEPLKRGCSMACHTKAVKFEGTHPALWTQFFQSYFRRVDGDSLDVHDFVNCGAKRTCGQELEVAMYVKHAPNIPTELWEGCAAAQVEDRTPDFIEVTFRTARYGDVDDPVMTDEENLTELFFEESEELCTTSLNGSGRDEVETAQSEQSEDTTVVWFIYLSKRRERALVWLVGAQYELRCEALQGEKLTRIYRCGATKPLFVLKDMIDLIRDTPPKADSVSMCSTCHLHCSAKSSKCLLCHYGTLVQHASVTWDEELELYVLKVQSIPEQNTTTRFALSDILPTFSFGTQTSSAFAQTLMGIWMNAAKQLTSNTRWERDQGANTVAHLMSQPETMELHLRPPNDGLANVTSFCWGNGLIQILATSDPLFTTLEISERGLTAEAFFRVLGFLRNGDQEQSRVEVAERTQRAVTTLRKGMGGIFTDNTHNCLHEGLRKILAMLESECVTAYRLFVGVISQRSICTACGHSVMTEVPLTLPTLCCPAKKEFDFVETLREALIEPVATSQNVCDGCKMRTTRTVTQKVQELPIIGVVPMHRRYFKVNPKTRGKTTHKSTAIVHGAKSKFTLKDSRGEVVCTPRAWGIHIGPKAEEGHYIAFIQRTALDTFCYNDSVVTLVPVFEVPEALISCVLFSTARTTTMPTQKRKLTTNGAVGISTKEGEQQGLEGPNFSKSTNPSSPSIEPGFAKQVKMTDADVKATPKKVAEAKVDASKLKREKVGDGCSYFTNDPSIEPAFHPDSHDAADVGDVLSIVNWNTRSLRNALTKAKGPLPFEIGCYDIVVLTETQGDLASLMKHARFGMCLAKYAYSYWNTCLLPGTQSKQGFGGVGVLCRKKPLQVQYGFGESVVDEQEGRLTVVRWKNVTLIAVYAPASLIDGKPERIQFDERLCKLVVKEKLRCPVFVVGDLNVPLEIPDASHLQPWLKGAVRLYTKDRESLRSLMSLNQLFDAGEIGVLTWFPEPTVTNQAKRIGMRLDYFLLPIGALVYRYYVLAESTSSDHRPVVVEFSLQGSKEEAKHFYRRELQEFTFMTLSSTYSLAAQMELLAMVVEKHLTQRIPEAPAVAFGAEGCMKFNSLRQPEFRQVEVDPAALDRMETDAMLDDLHLMEMRGVQESVTRYFQMDGARSDNMAPPRVEIYLGGHHHYALVDTGSDLCLVDYFLAIKQMLNFESKFVTLPGFTLQLGDGETKMRVLGRVHLTIQFKNGLGVFMNLTQWFYCVSQLPDCMVLGDALFKDQRARQADISQYHRSLQLDGVQIPYVDMFPHYHLYVDEDGEIPAHVEMSVLLTIGRTRGGVGVCCSGHVFDRVKAQDLVIVQSPTYACVSGFIQVKMLNSSSEIRRLMKGQSVACFQATEHLRDATLEERQQQSW